MTWQGNFVAIDGEGWDGKYTLLACSAMDYDLYNKRGLTTLECLEYLTAWKIPRNSAVVGYGLSYDFENILRDIPDEDYLRLTEDGERIRYFEFELMYIPRKILEITRHTNKKNKKGKPISKTVYLQDVLGFFQSSFEGALKKWEIPIPDIITEFKAKRDNFGPKLLPQIKKYNREELRLLIELMEKLRTADLEAFEAIGLKPNHTPRTWYGPGARASNFLKQTDWVDEHPPFEGPEVEDLAEKIIKRAGIGPETERAQKLREHPFASAYYGGRIEASALGTFNQELWDYDINSAYPYALSIFPKWEPEDLVYIEGLDLENRIGIYYIEWECPPGYNFYPFPYRSRSDNVFFPRRGRGWYMSPEVQAGLSVWGNAVKVIEGYVIEGTQGAGAGLRAPKVVCTTAKKISQMASIRLKAKAQKMTMEKALKLILNSCYGKTIQQVGSHKNLNLVASAWITSICRTLILRIIGRGEGVISVMTDGVLSTRPLPAKLGKELGFYECDKFQSALQFMPGVYYLEREDGSSVSRYRGMSKDFNPQKAIKILSRPRASWPIDMRIFVTRRLALHQPNAFGDKRFSFVAVRKREEFSLKSKRQSSTDKFRLGPGEAFKYFIPKEVPPLELMAQGSKPYVLDYPALLPYDSALTVEEILADNRISSALESELEAL